MTKSYELKRDSYLAHIRQSLKQLEYTRIFVISLFENDSFNISGGIIKKFIIYSTSSTMSKEYCYNKNQVCFKNEHNGNLIVPNKTLESIFIDELTSTNSSEIHLLNIKSRVAIPIVRGCAKKQEGVEPSCFCTGISLAL